MKRRRDEKTSNLATSEVISRTKWAALDGPIAYWPTFLARILALYHPKAAFFQR